MDIKNILKVLYRINKDTDELTTQYILALCDLLGHDDIYIKEKGWWTWNYKHLVTTYLI